MAKKQGNNYFEMFVNMVDYCCQAAEYLHGSLEKFAPELLQEQIKEMHAIEHRADIAKHDMMRKLVKEFITPIERDDIIELSVCIDDVTDAVEDVLLKMYMYNIRSLQPEAIEFSSIIEQCCKALQKALLEFHNFKKSSTIHDMLVEINRLEEVGDRLYSEAVRRLYTTGGDPLQVLAWTETYRRMEHCCDACEHAADVIESVIMQNS